MLTINDKAVVDSDVAHLETKTNEVTQILNKIHTCVLISLSKEIKGEEDDDLQVQQPNRQTPEEIASSDQKAVR